MGKIIEPKQYIKMRVKGLDIAALNAERNAVCESIKKLAVMIASGANRGAVTPSLSDIIDWNFKYLTLLECEIDRLNFIRPLFFADSQSGVQLTIATAM